MATGSGSSSNAWRMEDLQELALADDLQSGLHLSGINADFKLAKRPHCSFFYLTYTLPSMSGF